MAEDDWTTSGHYWLTLGMARSVGLNLCAAIRAQRMSRAKLDELVTRCETCGRQADCTRWLGRITQDATTPPAYCANRKSLSVLRKHAAGAGAAPANA